MNNRELHLSESYQQRMSLENELDRNQFDDLTGLQMIGRFFQNAPESIREMRKQGKTPAVLWVDFSRLREYNALHGFETGDKLIRGLAWLLRDQFGVWNTTRFNGDYFVVCTETEDLEENIRHVFGEAAKLSHGNSRPVAVGIYVMDEEDIGLATAIDRAKLAHDSLNEPMHSSYVYFGQEMLEKAELRQYILQNCQRAMDEGWIRVFYQPVVRTVTGKICGAEALCRWRDPVHGMISPGEFIPVLEEEGLISGLDLYMIEQVCRDGRELIQAGRSIVPVSVNLSRKDFRDPELVDKIENLAKNYGIPRELLNIEVTESAFIRHPERLSTYISCFHELGFQVWMDDFGTGYSSLGSLKDLKFDELKIDMSFLSTSTDKARCIITSVVRMAKEIGIQTLAEGVETAEQYEFLKKIGCEKIQGYFFGKPVDKETFRKACRERQMEEEKPRWRNYYDALSRIDFQTGEPLCVIEDDGVRLHLLFANDDYLAVLRRDNIEDIDKWIEEINTNNNPAHAFHRQYADERLRKLPGTQVITYPSGDHYMELTGNVVTHYENFYIYALNIRYIQLSATSDDQNKALYIQYMYYLCNDIAICSLKENMLYALKSMESSQPAGVSGEKVNLEQAVHIYAQNYIYPPDQKRYSAFLNPKILKEKMCMNNGQDITGFFRSRTADGQYRWMLHMLMAIPKTDFDQYLLITIPIDFDPDMRGVLQNGTDSRPGSDIVGMAEGDAITPSLLWRNLEAYAGGMYFWKDINRRFVGASRSFLDYYGFDSEGEILGKTDEDMHWHVEPEAFRQDELSVLRYGKRTSFVKGKCIARGKQRTILASKIPIFRDGRIIGLMGIFYDTENMLSLINRKYQSLFADEITGLFNAKGIAESLIDYLEALWTEDTDFSKIQVHIPEYPAFRDIYGDRAGNTLLCSVGEVLKEIFGKDSIIGRLTGSYFTILIQDVDTEHLRTARKKTEEEISRLRKVGEWTCALTADVQMSVLNQQNAGRDIYAKDLDRMLTEFGERDTEDREESSDSEHTGGNEKNEKNEKNEERSEENNS